MAKRWRRGDTVVLRYPPEDRMVRSYRASTGDTVVNVAGWPHVVLEDKEDLVAVYLPEGSPFIRWNVAEGRSRPAKMSQGDSVRLFFPGKPYEVSLFYDTGTGPASWVRYYFPGEQGRFYGWKVDITSPFARTEIYTEADAARLRDIGREVIELIEAAAFPFDDFWPNWQPEPGLVVGEIPSGWQDVPVPPPYKQYDGPLT
jgi:hypothetical protein